MTKRHHILAVKVSFTVKKPTYFHCLAQFPPVCRIRAYSAGSLLEQRPQSNKSAATPRLNTFSIFRGAFPPPPFPTGSFPYPVSRHVESRRRQQAWHVRLLECPHRLNHRTDWLVSQLWARRSVLRRRTSCTRSTFSPRLTSSVRYPERPY